MDAIDRTSAALRKLLQEMDPLDLQEEYQEILDLLDREDLLDVYPSRSSPMVFASQLLSPNRNPKLARLAERAVGAEEQDNPIDLVLNLLPSDSHLE
jgi:hypothetical protein